MAFEGGAKLLSFRLIWVGMALGLLCVSLVAGAQTFEVKGEGVRFQPEIIFARQGDVIAFRKMVPHAAESIEEMWPQGAELLSTPVGGDADYVVATEGVYLFRCPQHWGARMVGAIVVEGTEDVPGTVAAYLDQANSEPLKPAKRLLKRLAMVRPSVGGTP